MKQSTLEPRPSSEADRMFASIERGMRGMSPNLDLGKTKAGRRIPNSNFVACPALRNVFHIEKPRVVFTRVNDMVEPYPILVKHYLDDAVLFDPMPFMRFDGSTRSGPVMIRKSADEESFRRFKPVKISPRLIARLNSKPYQKAIRIWDTDFYMVGLARPAHIPPPQKARA